MKEAMVKHDERTTGEKIADAVASFGGSWRFILTAIAIIIVWVIYNLLIPSKWQFDTYPFILLNLVLSLVAAFQAPFILMSQGRAEKKAEEAHRRTLRGIRRLVEKDIRIEKEILMILKNQNKDVEYEILKLLKSRDKASHP
jgi:uncharacterized membrane protein